MIFRIQFNSYATPPLKNKKTLIVIASPALRGTKQSHQCLRLFLLTLFLSPLLTFSCECPQMEDLNKEALSKYHIIFTGTIDSITKQNEGKCAAWFSIKELYKGESSKQVKIIFDCTTECQMDFNLNSEWLIYANYIKYGEASVDVCSRSRIKIAKDVDDLYAAINGTFSNEITFLKNNFGTQTITEQKEKTEFIPDRVNIQPEPMSKLYLVIISLVCFVLIYIIFKKWIK